jgi:hypothetical protein
MEQTDLAVNNQIVNKKNKTLIECTVCNIFLASEEKMTLHNSSSKHIKMTDNLATSILDMEKSANSAKNFVCKFCDITCNKKNDWDRHLVTSKHLKRENGNKTPQISFSCKCGKKYANNSGLWKHNKTCKINDTIIKNVIVDTTVDDDNDTSDIENDTINDIENDIENDIDNQIQNIVIKKDLALNMIINDNKDFKKLILEVLKSNTELQKQTNELQKQLVDVCKNSNTTNHINSHNKTFNLTVFLNEKCKDAMNISDFANTFELQLSDLESVGELGYVEGISKIIVDKLNAMDIHKRPMHCSDAKRETIYVKDEDVWTKEERHNPKLRQAIKNISFKNMKLVYNWSNAHPESMDNESRLNDTYMKLVLESTGGNGPITESENKIIRRIAREIVIEKS